MKSSVLFLSLLLPLLLPSTLACGGFFCEPQRPVVQSGEAIVFGVDGNLVTMHVQILYEGPAEAFSWVLPVPVEPDDISVGSDLMFTSLFQETLPQWQLEIDETASDTCTVDALEPTQCAFPEASPEADFEQIPRDVIDDGAQVLDQGSVGPFDFVVLQAAENNPSSVLEWLNENGYDQPEGSGPLLNYYAVNNHVFVALRLQKQAETGEIQPLIMSFTMPSDDLGVEQSAAQVSRRAMACVPIQLTRIAAVESMPIQVYILGEGRAVPLNFVEIELDENQAQWLPCRFNPACYYDDFIARFDAAASQLVNHSFVTEFAGDSQIVADTIEIQDVTEDILAQATSIGDFVDNYRNRLPDLPLVDTIVQDFFESEPFNATGLAAEIETKVLKPAREAQAFVDGFPYLTRLYARLSPDYMTKDPFFSFKPELPDVDRTRRATAIPVCTDPNGFLEPTGLIIQAEGQSSSIQVAATMECGGWVQTSGQAVPDPVVSPARQISSHGFTGDDGVIVLRNDDGSFDQNAIFEAIGFGDSLVMNQTIPEYTSDASGSGSSGTDTSTDPPSTGDPPASDAASTWKSRKHLLIQQLFPLLGLARWYF